MWFPVMHRRCSAHIKHFKFVPAIEVHEKSVIFTFKKFHHAANGISQPLNGFQCKFERSEERRVGKEC